MSKPFLFLLSEIPEKQTVFLFLLSKSKNKSVKETNKKSQFFRILWLLLIDNACDSLRSASGADFNQCDWKNLSTVDHFCAGG